MPTTSSWLSIHFRPLETQEVFLTRAFKPFLAHYIWPNKGTRAFFIRYEDESGPHLRLRFKAEPAWLTDTLLPAFESWMSDRGSWTRETYQPAPDRFGGLEALVWAEEHFHISTRVVLDRLSGDLYTYGDAIFDALRMHLVMGFAAGMKKSDVKIYFERLCLAWLPVFFRTNDQNQSAKDLRENVLEDFEKSYASQSAAIAQALQQFWEELEKNKIDKNQADWLRWIRGNELTLQGMGSALDKALPHLLHFNSNRLGINNQDETYLNYILSQAL